MLAFPPAFRYNGKAGIVPAARLKRPGGALNHIVRCKRQMAEFKYEITERIAVLSQSPNGWERQLNMVSWNGREPKYDIRDWAPDGSKMGKGISLSHDEIAILKGILEEMEI